MRLRNRWRAGPTGSTLPGMDASENGDLLGFAQSVLARQPFSQLVGARVTSFGDGSATLEVEIDGRHRQQHQLVHGGMLCYAADNAITFAAGTVLGPSLVTGGLTIHYLRGGREGVLRATGTVAHHNERQAVCTAEIEMVASDGTTTRCAIASGTVVATSGGGSHARTAS